MKTGQLEKSGAPGKLKKHDIQKNKTLENVGGIEKIQKFMKILVKRYG